MFCCFESNSIAMKRSKTSCPEMEEMVQKLRIFMMNSCVEFVWGLEMKLGKFYVYEQWAEDTR
jgi:hypothetical protein